MTPMKPGHASKLDADIKTVEQTSAAAERIVKDVVRKTAEVVERATAYDNEAKKNA